MYLFCFSEFSHMQIKCFMYSEWFYLEHIISPCLLKNSKFLEFDLLFWLTGWLYHPRGKRIYCWGGHLCLVLHHLKKGYLSWLLMRLWGEKVPVVLRVWFHLLISYLIPPCGIKNFGNKFNSIDFCNNFSCLKWKKNWFL